MTNSKIHIVYSPFTGVGLKNGYRGGEWFRERIEIFKKYTLPSLLNQSNKNFIHWMSFRSQERNHPLVKELADYLSKLPYSFIMTFDGLMYHDDKFGLKNLPMNAARVIRDWKRNKRVKLSELKELINDKNKTLPQRLQSSLSVVKSALEGKQFDMIYLTRIDTDDMLHREALAEMQGIESFEGSLVYRDGYIYNDLTKELAEWRPLTNPPFHTIMFLKEVFFDPRKHLEYMKGFQSHEDIPNLFKYYNLSNGKYCVTVHNPRNHISTVWSHPYKGPQIIERKDIILKEFGI